MVCIVNETLTCDLRSMSPDVTVTGEQTDTVFHTEKDKAA